MRTKPWNSMLLVFALVAGCLSVAPQAAVQDELEIFPTPESGITIPARGENAMTMEELLVAFGEASGEYLTWTPETGGLLKVTTVGFDRELVVEPKDLYSVVGTVMLVHRFVFTDLRRSEPRMMVVTCLDSAARSNLKQGARFVAVEDLHHYADHPGMLISTTLHLPNLDGRVLTNALRGLTTDPNTMNVVPVPESNSVIMTGFTSTIIDLSQMLRRLDEASEPKDAVPPGATRPPGGR